jgi:glycosyltransferase involved in cell wall biosynthesis
MQTLLTIVIPAYNEEEALSTELPKIIDHCTRHKWQVIVVNDGSTDRSKEVLDRYQDVPCLNVFHHKVNRGYGGALKTGITNVTTEFVATMDADGQHRLEDITTLLLELQKYNADMIVGSRKNQKSANLYRALGKWIIRTVARILVPNTIADLNSGLKVYRTELAQQQLILCPDSMAFSDVITLVFIHQRHLVIEHPITVQKRIAGHSTIGTRTAVTTILEVFNLLMLFRPMRLLLPVAVLFVLTGVLWGLPIVLKGRGISVAALLAIITGTIIFFFGLIAEQLSLIRRERMAFFKNLQK